MCTTKFVEKSQKLYSKLFNFSVIDVNYAKNTYLFQIFMTFFSYLCKFWHLMQIVELDQFMGFWSDLSQSPSPLVYNFNTFNSINFMDHQVIFIIK